MSTLPIRASIVAMTCLCTLGCQTYEERREELLNRRAALLYQHPWMTTPDPVDWSERPVLGSREFAIAEIDRELAELEREQAGKSFSDQLAENILIGLGNSIGEAIWDGVTGDDE